MLYRILPALALTVAIAPAVLAGEASPKVGEAAPEIGDAPWVMNAPDETSIEALRGDVIFVEKWGVKCGPCVALIPHVEKLAAEHGPKGLHVFAFEAQGHTEQQTRDKIKERGGKSYAVATGGGGAYQTGGGIPHAWLIGVDGKVIWEGNPAAATSQVDNLIKTELAKVKFPGLGKLSVDKAVLPAAAKYLKKDLAGARTDAQKVADGEKSSEEAKTDAAHVVARIDKIGAQRWAKAQRLEEGKRYLEALDVYGFLQAAFKGAKEAQDAAARLKDMKADEGIQREIAAARALQQVLDSLKGKPAADRKAQLEAFAKAKKFEGTQAAAEAQQLAQ